MIALAFHVPNSEEGKEFIRLMRKFKNRKEVKLIRVRGRGKNRKQKMLAKKGFINSYHDIDIAEADYYAVYLITSLNKYSLPEAEKVESFNRGYAQAEAFNKGYDQALLNFGIQPSKTVTTSFLKNKRLFNFEGG